MAYDVTLVQVNAVYGGFRAVNSHQSFPHADVPGGQNFDTILYSYWLCFPTNTAGTSSVGPAFVPCFGFGPGVLDCSDQTIGTSGLGGTGHIFEGTFPWANYNVRSHVLLSINAGAKLCQLYINDARVTVSETWLAGVHHLNLGQYSSLSEFEFNVGGSLSSGIFPALADVWCASTPSFVDLSIVSNRRKFINADLSPVYLGVNGSAPFGYQPNVYLTVPAGGVPDDFLVNRGMGGTNFTTSGGGTAEHPVPWLTFQESGLCSVPVVEAPLGVGHIELSATNPACSPYWETFAGGAAAKPEWRLTVSDDGGRTWSTLVKPRSIGQLGEYLTRLRWMKMGHSRERMVRLECSDPVRRNIVGFYLDVTQGMG